MYMLRTHNIDFIWVQKNKFQHGNVIIAIYLQRGGGESVSHIIVSKDLYCFGSGSERDQLDVQLECNINGNYHHCKYVM